MATNLARQARFDIVNRKSDIVKRFWHLRRNRKRGIFEHKQKGQELPTHSIFVKGHRLIQALGEHAKFKTVLTHPGVMGFENSDDVSRHYKSEEVHKLPRALLRHILTNRGGGVPDDYYEVYGQMNPLGKMGNGAGATGSSASRPSCGEDDPEGELVLGELAQPPPAKAIPDDAKFVVALDRVKYPVNLAMLLNTLVVLGADCVFLTHGTCDPWNWKVLEASQGTHWDLPIMWGTPEECVEMAKSRNLEPIVAHVDASTPSCAPQDVNLNSGSKGVMLVLGSEAHGPCEVFTEACKHVSLPMADLTESLNVGVAGGILAHLVQQKVLPKFDPELIM